MAARRSPLLLRKRTGPARVRDLLENKKGRGGVHRPPYNVKVQGHVSGNGSSSHREFPMASGEMTEEEFTGISRKHFKICVYSSSDAIIYACMDWRHTGEILAQFVRRCELINLCVWVKGKRRHGLALSLQA